MQAIQLEAGRPDLATPCKLSGSSSYRKTVRIASQLWVSFSFLNWLTKKKKKINKEKKKIEKKNTTLKVPQLFWLRFIPTDFQLSEGRLVNGT